LHCGHEVPTGARLADRPLDLDRCLGGEPRGSQVGDRSLGQAALVLGVRGAVLRV